MKIFCVGMNYANHNKELNHKIGEIEGINIPSSALSSAPTIFLKPETALARNDWPVFVPDFTEEFEYETELVVRINRLGKSIPERFAHRYYEEITLGIDFTARDLQRQLKAKGLPWDISKGFDSSAFCGEFIKLGNRNIQDLHFEMQLNGETRQIGYTGDMLHTVDQIIAHISRFYILKTGDLIFTGTPAGVGKLKEGDIITGSLEGQQILKCLLK
ncbi:MAG: fumarylacetoacetate hydrolase family protein [Bacteroidales bacterium]|nr:fumarylacetoacetate hydrolase family protein [Bacteroidales bacterium]